MSEQRFLPDEEQPARNGPDDGPVSNADVRNDTAIKGAEQADTDPGATSAAAGVALPEDEPADSLAAVVRARAQSRAAATFVEDAHGGSGLSYAAAWEVVRRYEAALAQLGVSPAARVLLDVTDPVTFASAYIGVISSGRVAAPVNPSAPIPEVRRDTSAVEPVAVVTDKQERGVELGLAVLVGTPTGPEVLVAETAVPTGPVDELPQHAGRGGALLVTSGSTSAPKAVELGEQRLLHVAGSIAEHNELTTADRGYNSLPLFHINGEVVGVLATLHAGAALVLDERFRKNGFWELVTEQDITWINAVPAILTILAEQPVPMRPPRLRFVRSASAPLPAAVRATIDSEVGVPVVESYGMTEAASQITATPLDGSAPTGSCGHPVGVSVTVRDGAGNDLPPGEVGHVCLRGPGVITGYVGGRAADRFDADGWLDSRDMGCFDENGFLFLVGRADDVINRGGENIYPREIEEVLRADPAVQEAAVAGRAHEVLGAVPTAHVIPVDAPATSAEHDELVERLSARCAARLSRFKQPEEIHLVSDLPRGSTGKVQRNRLNEPTPVTS